MSIQFGVFDHMDRGEMPLADQFEQRLQLAEAYEAAGFDRLHIAEHHSTPLGMAPSPGIFLSAVAQRTRRLRFGPLVYPIKLYHPLRLTEEICMLDHLSRGRFEFGIGKGASSIELSLYSVDPANTEKQFAEAWTVIRQALTQDNVNFEGEFYRFSNVPVELKPLQRPHPAIWYGVSRPDGAERAAHKNYNIVCNLPPKAAKAVVDAYRSTWAATNNPDAAMPRVGIGRFLVVAETDAEARAIATRAFPRWQKSFLSLWERKGRAPPVRLPDRFEDVEEAGIGVAGSPSKVRDALCHHVQQSGVNYLVGRFAFGDLCLEESLRSARLFSDHVMPALRELTPAT